MAARRFPGSNTNKTYYVFQIYNTMSRDKSQRKDKQWRVTGAREPAISIFFRNACFYIFWWRIILSLFRCNNRVCPFTGQDSIILYVHDRTNGDVWYIQCSMRFPSISGDNDLVKCFFWTISKSRSPSRIIRNFTWRESIYK